MSAHTKSPPTRPWTVLVLALVCAWIAFEFAVSARAPFLSEDWTHLAEARELPTLFSALDPRLEPLRPLQHAFFWVLAHCGADPAGAGLPLVAHVFGFALHAAACACVYWLARAAGARDAGALVALALFAAFPNVKSVAWSAAIGNPGRVCFELAALLAFVRHLRAPSAKYGVSALALFGIALAWHESAMEFVAILALWIAFVEADSIRGGIRRVIAAARDPWIRVLIAITVAYVVALALRAGRHHQVKSLDALPANVAKASTALLPESVRTLVLDGFRGVEGSSAPLAYGALATLALVTLILALRSQRARFVAAACAVDMGLPVLGAGFEQRYAYFASALVAIALGTWIARSGGGLRMTAVLALVAWWGHDAYVDARDFRDLSRSVPELVTELRTLREREGSNTVIALVDPPDMVGAERDIPVFNWGFDFMLASNHVAGPWLYWRTHAFRTSTNVEFVEQADIERARAAGTPKLFPCVLSTQR